MRRTLYLILEKAKFWRWPEMYLMKKIVIG